MQSTLFTSTAGYNYNTRIFKRVGVEFIFAFLLFIVCAATSDIRAAFIVFMIVVIVRYIAVFNRDVYYITHMGINEDMVTIQYYKKAQLHTVSLPKEQIIARKKSAFTKTNTPYLWLNLNNETTIKQFEYLDWDNAKIDIVINLLSSNSNLYKNKVG